MTVERIPETVYVLQTLAEEAKLISRGNTPRGSSIAYLNNVAKVIRPSFAPDDLGSLLTIPRPGLALWPTGLGNGEQMTGERRWHMKVRWVGLVDATTPENGQDRVLGLLDDVYRMMTSNPGREHPSAIQSANPYGIHTSDQGEMAILIDYAMAQENQLVCFFDGLFDIEMRSPW